MSHFSSYISLASEILQIVALIIGSSWAFYQFRKFRKHTPKLDTNNDIESIRREGKSAFLRIRITVRNIGEVAIKDFKGSASICDFSKISNNEIQKLNKGELPDNICLFDFELSQFDYKPELIEPGEKDYFVKDIKIVSLPEVLEMHSHIKNVHFKPRGRFFKKEKEISLGWTYSSIHKFNSKYHG